MTTTKVSILFILIFLLIVSQPAKASDENLSWARTWGVGLQFTGEGFGLSFRYWLDPELGIGFETTAFFWPQVVTTVSLRGLVRLFDREVNDLYVGLGVGWLSADKDSGSLFLQGIGGIESSNSTQLAWHREFGLEVLSEAARRLSGLSLTTVFGGGLYYYPN